MSRPMTTPYNRLKAERVRLITDVGWAFHALPYVEVEAFLKDPTAWRAKQVGVTLEHYAQWEQRLETGWECKARTKLGLRCLNKIEPVDVSDYEPKIHDYCSVHRGKENV